jgi:hypothetical protein
MLVIGHPLTNLNRIFAIIGKISSKSQTAQSPGEFFQSYLVRNAVVIASVMCVRFLCEIKWTPENDWTDYARKKLTYGDVPPSKAKQLARLATGQGFYDGIPAPPYAEEVVGLLKNLFSNALAATIAPYICDARLFEPPGVSWDGMVGMPMSRALVESANGLVKQIVSVVGYASGVDPRAWRSFFPFGAAADFRPPGPVTRE